MRPDRQLREWARRLRRDHTLRAQLNKFLPQDPVAASKRTLFIHIPKTGGVSLSAYLVRKLRARNPITIIGAQQLSLMTDDQLAQHDYIATHTNSSIMSRLPNCFKITLLRDPVDRVLSSYHFHRRDKRNETITNLARDLDLLQFVSSDHPVIHANIENSQTRQLIQRSEGAGDPIASLSDDEILKRVRATLDQFDVVGRLEDMAATLERLRELYGWKNVGKLPHKNRSWREGKSRELDPRVEEIIRQRTRLDQIVYDDVRSRFG